ncbi:UNKNOWN [Stylonychia lemnae]|uniref:Uncharacterized protein n=1 Tax=Stylonychia lemnae TaxID=5949 RepID=A0A077ZY55_STYLE|nr:UNKNOWN [Stylonychia lemnae]|eukprot:CDW74562.1 UNKNOWN [Stylonychia lemnae]
MSFSNMTPFSGGPDNNDFLMNNNNNIFGFSNQKKTIHPLTAVNQSRLNQIVKSPVKKIKPNQNFIAYLEERDEKGYLLSGQSPMQHMIERVREQKYNNNALRWTTEKNLRETRKNAMSKIQQSLKISSQNSNAYKNISTAENSVDITQISPPPEYKPVYNLSDFIMSKENSLEIKNKQERQYYSGQQSPEDFNNYIQVDNQNISCQGYNINEDNDDHQGRNEIIPTSRTHKSGGNNFESFRIQLLPGQENTFRSRITSKSIQTSNHATDNAIIQALNRAKKNDVSPRAILGLKEISQGDITRVYIKECKNQQIKYRFNDNNNISRKIPESELQNEINTDYKRVIANNRGNQVFSAFSPTARFTQKKLPYNVDQMDFSMLDVHDKLFVNKNELLYFNKQAGRKNIFLTPDQVKIMDEQAVKHQQKIQKLQQFKEMVKDNEKKYAVNKQWRVTFQYDEHKNVKQLKPWVKEMVRQIRGHTDGAKLSHFDINQIRGLKNHNDDSD